MYAPVHVGHWKTPFLEKCCSQSPPLWPPSTSAAPPPAECATPPRATPTPAPKTQLRQRELRVFSIATFPHIVFMLLQVHKLHICEFICNWYVVVPCVYSSLKPVCGAPAPSLQRWWCPAGGALSPLASEPPAAVRPPKRKREKSHLMYCSVANVPKHMWRISVLCCTLKFKFGKLGPAKSYSKKITVYVNITFTSWMKTRHCYSLAEFISKVTYNWQSADGNYMEEMVITLIWGNLQ